MNCLVADLGGTRIKIGVLHTGTLLAQDIIPVFPGESMAKTMHRIGVKLETLCARLGMTADSCDGFAAGFPALVDSKRNRVLNHYGKYPGAPGFDFDGWVEDRWGLPVTLENDSRMALVGEFQHGAGRTSERLAIVTLGTGIGTAIMLDGIPLRGPNFSAGNLCGHWIVNPGGISCSCGNHGCIEAETGGGTLPQRAREWLQVLGRETELPQTLDYKSLLELARQDIDWACEMRDKAINHWAVLCSTLTNTFDLDCVILGGGVMHASREILPRLKEQAKRHIIGAGDLVNIRPAEHPDNMALLGGEWLLKEKKQQ